MGNGIGRKPAERTDADGVEYNERIADRIGPLNPNLERKAVK